jgi:carboxypeptidase family protein
MSSPCAPSSWRGFQLLLGKQAFLPAFFGRLVFWQIVTSFLLITSPSLFAQTNDNTATVGGRIAGQAKTPALPDNTKTVRGRVTDSSGAVVAGAAVTLVNLATEQERVLTTDVNGNFAFAASNGARELENSMGPPFEQDGE